MAKMIIAGEQREASDGGTTEIRNPATGELVDRVASATQEDVDRAIDAAETSFKKWSSVPPPKRAEILFTAAHILKEREKELALLLTKEQGKPLREAVLEIRRFAHTLEHYAGLAKTIRGGYVPALDDRRYGMIIKRPIGVCGSIVPWNFPVSLLGNKIGPALITGNTVVVKPAGTTPLTDIQVVHILHEAGLPPGVLNVVPGPGGIVAESLLKDPRVRKIGFTGATSTGKHVMEVAAQNVTRVTLELGGSDPMIVCDDADIRRATAATAIGRFFNAGQACLAVKRVYLFEQIAEEFMTKIADRAKKEWPVGDGLKEGVKMGPLHTERQRAEVESQVADAVKRGAKVLAGGKRPEGKEFEKGWYMEATVLRDVPEDSRMSTEEVFGPALPIFIVKDLDDAVAKANASVYGLGSSIWTKDLAKARKAAELLEAGYTWVNDIQVAYDQLPFGGTKQSGFGKEHGIDRKSTRLNSSHR